MLRFSRSVTAAFAAGAVLASAAVAKPTPVALKTIGATPTAVRAGGTVTAKAVVVAGRGARSLRLRYVLSRDARPSREDRELALVTLGHTRAGKRVARRTVLTVPAAVTAGRYQLVGCIAAACRAV